MGAYARDEKLLIHFFQESLTGAAATWYTNLEPSQVHSRKDLMVAFVRQYQYNSDVAPDRMQLHNMGKKGHESFKGYGSPTGAPNDGKGDDNSDSGHVTNVLL